MTQKLQPSHDTAKIPTIEQFLKNNSKKFYDSASSNENELIQKLGNYASSPLPFRLKHKLPRAIPLAN